MDPPKLYPNYIPSTIPGCGSKYPDWEGYARELWAYIEYLEDKLEVK